MKNPLTFNQYQEAMSQGRLLGLYCEDCGVCTVPPQTVCMKCGGLSLTIKEIDRTGILRTFTVIRVAPEGMTPPYLVALVETASGAWILGNLTDLETEEACMELMGSKVGISTQLVKGDMYACGDIYSPVFTLL
jgi:uncharacterized OB-fold protein